MMAPSETRVTALRETLARHETLHELREAHFKDLVDEVRILSDEEALLGRVDEALLQISTKVLGQSTVKIDKLVTAGLRMVFEGEDLRFTTILERFRGKTAVRFKLTARGIEAPIMEAYGGGVLAIAAVLLRVVAIMVLDMRRILILDESLSMVSRPHIPGASRLLKKLGAELGFAILMVTHQDRFAEYADRHYAAKRAPGGTEFHVVGNN